MTQLSKNYGVKYIRKVPNDDMFKLILRLYTYIFRQAFDWVEKRDLQRYVGSQQGET